jgi:two-component system, LytTR family, response regulator
MPLVAFVTAYDEYAVQAFKINAVDYLLKPVELSRLRDCINRAQYRLESINFRTEEVTHIQAATKAYETATGPSYL